MLDVKVECNQTASPKEIQNFVADIDTEVLVGFMAGRQHVPTLHKADTEKPNEKRRGKYVGIDGRDDSQNEPAIETAELAKILTFGSANIPPRPFIEEGLLSEKEELLKEAEKQTDNARKGQANWAKLGTKAVGAVQKFVRSDYYKTNVPNSRHTIEFKGSDTPLIDGGDLINSLEFVVEGKK